MRVCRERKWLTSLIRTMNTVPIALESRDYCFMLALAGRLRALQEGAEVHLHMVKCKRERDSKIVTELIKMYGRCGKPSTAGRCFEKLFTKKPQSWAAIIRASAENGHGDIARAYFKRMLEQPLTPDKPTYLAVLRSFFGSQDLPALRQIHTMIREKSSLGDDPEILEALITTYGKCRSPRWALTTFRQIRRLRRPTSWVRLIAAVAENGHHGKADHLMSLMYLEGLAPCTPKELVRQLRKCRDPSAASRVRVLHRCMYTSWVGMNLDVRAHLILAYGRCRKLAIARGLFDQMNRRDSYLWTIMFRTYVERRAYGRTLALFELLKQRGMSANIEILLNVLCACKTYDQCKSFHESIIVNGWHLSEALRELMIRKYGSYREVVDGWAKFRELNLRFKASLPPKPRPEKREFPGPSPYRGWSVRGLMRLKAGRRVRNGYSRLI